MAILICSGLLYLTGWVTQPSAEDISRRFSPGQRLRYLIHNKCFRHYSAFCMSSVMVECLVIITSSLIQTTFGEMAYIK